MAHPWLRQWICISKVYQTMKQNICPRSATHQGAGTVPGNDWGAESQSAVK